MDHGQDPTSIRWDVRREHIDLDRWAQVVVKATAANAQGDRPPPTRWGTWPALALVGILVVALAALSSSWVMLAAFVPALVLVGGLLIASRASAKRLAKRLHATPAASEPFTFVADERGTHDASESGSGDLAWRRYVAAALDDDVIALTLDNTSVRVLPNRSLTSGQAPGEAVDRMARWIAEAETAGGPDPQTERRVEGGAGG